MRDNLYHEFRDIVKEIHPNIIVIENVKGILSKKNKKGGKIIEDIISDFENQGYNFENEKTGKKYVLVNASDFGVPQKRERILLIGINKNWKNVSIPHPTPTHQSPELIKGKQQNLLPYVTLYEAIGDLPKVTPKTTMTGLSKKDAQKTIQLNKNISSGNDKIKLNKKAFEKHLANISLSGRKFYEFVRPNGYEFIDHHVSRNHQVSDLTLFTLMKEGETAGDFIERKPAIAKKLIKYKMNSFKDKYRKQKRDEPATTIFAHLEKDGNRFIHPTQSRTLTPREAARIQSFPDDFLFEGPISKKFKQIGNAVPPLLSYVIANEINKIYQSSDIHD